MEQIMNYIKPELLVLIPVLYFIGVALKKAEGIKDKHIPLWLGLTGILLAVIWVLATGVFAGWQSVLLGVFTALVQGVLCAGCSVYANQIVKQAGTSEVSPENYMTDAIGFKIDDGEEYPDDTEGDAAAEDAAGAYQTVATGGDGK